MELVKLTQQLLKHPEDPELALQFVALCHRTGVNTPKQINHLINKTIGKKYLYMITFTLKEDMEDYDEIERYIIKQGSRKALKLTQWTVKREYTKQGRAHWHVLAESTKCLKKDRFNYYISKYGFIDISRSKTGESDEILNYITKEGAQNLTQGPLK